MRTIEKYVGVPREKHNHADLAEIANRECNDGEFHLCDFSGLPAAIDGVVLKFTRVDTSEEDAREAEKRARFNDLIERVYILFEAFILRSAGGDDPPPEGSDAPADSGIFPHEGAQAA